MSKQTDTEPEFHAESLNDIFLRDRPSLKKLFPEIFGELQSKSIVSVSGSSSLGKSIFLYELMARALMQDDEAEVLFLDIDKQFNIFKFKEICSKFLPESDETEEESTQARAEAIVKNLDKLHIVNNFISYNIRILIGHLNEILSKNRRISLVVLDSIGSFYYSEAAAEARKGPSLSKDKFIMSYLKKFKLFADQYEVSFAFSKPSFMTSLVRNPIITHDISLSQSRDNVYLMRIRTDDEIKEVNYTINETGFELLRENLNASRTLNESQIKEEEIVSGIN